MNDEADVPLLFQQRFRRELRASQLALHYTLPSEAALAYVAQHDAVPIVLVYGIWVLAVNGAVSPLALLGRRGTALTPLAAQIGPIVQVCGVVLVVLLFGMSSIHASFGLFNLVNERLPTRSHVVVMLFRRRDRLLMRPRGTSTERLYAGLTYLGLMDGVPQCRLDIQCDGRVHHIEVAVAQCWEAIALYDRRPELRQRGLHLTREVLHTSSERMRLQVTSAMTLTYEGGWDTVGFSVPDVLMLPDTQRQLIN